MIRRKRKKTLLKVAQELTVETTRLQLIGVRSHVDVFNAAMKLEKQREPQPQYIR
jgi:hypothetical protein